MKNKNNTNEMNKNTTPTEVIEYLTNYFETFGNLPTPVIECQVSGTAYTAFGTNLKGKIEKAGGIKELLTTFTGKGQVKKSDVKATITPRKKSTKKVDKTEETISTNEDVIKAAFLVASVTPNE